MKIVQWFKRKLNPRMAAAPIRDNSPKPLREFVYLDEVSLRSLLSSQTGEVTEGKSEQSSDSLQTQLDSTLGATAPMLAKSELTSRFQTTNSSTLQTSRKATVQSWFREFHSLTGLRLIEPAEALPTIADISELLAVENPSIITPASELKRGALVEFRVKLKADPVFHLGTMVTEFSSMVDEAPELFAGNNVFSSLFEAQRVNNILQRLLAGLIPIRAEALDYRIVSIDGVEYVAHKDCLNNINLPETHFELVGVTEHLAYWKDIRRVLFSDAEFTMLCRVARSDLQSTWTPVKLGDLFRDVAPDMVEAINTASRSPFEGANGGTSINTNELLLNQALTQYKDALLFETGKQLTPQQDAEITGQIAQLGQRAATAVGQRSAFQYLLSSLREMTDLNVGPDKDVELRDNARLSTGLPLFPSATNNLTTVVTDAPALPDTSTPRLLDVEVIAIYW